MKKGYNAVLDRKAAYFPDLLDKDSCLFFGVVEVKRSSYAAVNAP